MPLYEYSCESCETEFEFLVRGSEQPECPRCGGSSLQRLLSVPAAHSGSRRSLPISAPNSGPPCGAGFCRTGQCNLGD